MALCQPFCAAASTMTSTRQAAQRPKTARLRRVLLVFLGGCLGVRGGTPAPPCCRAGPAPETAESGTTTRMSFSRGDRTVFAVKDVEIQTIQAKVKDDNDEAAATHTFTRYYKKVDEDKDDTKEDTTP